jgi:hypothetical protein
MRKQQKSRPEGIAVYITFKNASGSETLGSRVHRQRSLQGVPRAVAKEIYQDVRNYQNGPPSGEAQPPVFDQSKLYRFVRKNEEILVPLNLREVVDVLVVDGSQTSSKKEK